MEMKKRLSEGAANVADSLNNVYNSSFEDLLKSLPKDVYQMSTWRAFTVLFKMLFFCTVGYIALAIAPWFLLPVTWLFIGTVFSGLYSVGYNCGIGSFSKYKIVNSIVGHIVSLPLLVPFESWKEQLVEQRKKLLSAVPSYDTTTSTTLWWLQSTFQWVKANFGLRSVYKPGKRLSLIFSVSLLYIAAFFFFSIIIYYFGIWGVCKYWLAPWLVYHFWISSFLTTSFNKPLRNLNSEMQHQIQNTTFQLVVHCKYPKWVEFLSNHLNVQMTAEHISSLGNLLSYNNLSINYNALYNALRDRYPQYLEEIPFGWNAIKAEGGVKINWPTTLFLIITPLLSLYGFSTTELHPYTAIVALFSYFFGGLGITMGYHRYWAHRSYEAKLPVQIVLLLMGSSAFEGSIIWWARDHRAHHRFSDTEKDPYGVDRGFLWAHVGWMMVKQDESKIGKVNITDLEQDPLVRFQANNYFLLAFLFGWIIPICICGFGWGDWRGGFFYAAIFRTVVVMQATFCINSLAHYMGNTTFTDQRSSRDNYFTSLLTFGEGYHNFHHEFPSDYRNGVRYHNYDPSKWLIFLLSKVGLTYDLKKFSSNEIEKGALQMQMKKLEEKKALLKWGPEISTLPEWTIDQVKEKVEEGAKLVMIEEVVHDVAEFKKIHPGGEKFLDHFIGKDATRPFNGGVYNHSNAARNVLAHYRIAKVVVESSDKRFA